MARPSLHINRVKFYSKEKMQNKNPHAGMAMSLLKIKNPPFKRYTPTPLMNVYFRNPSLGQTRLALEIILVQSRYPPPMLAVTRSNYFVNSVSVIQKICLINRLKRLLKIFYYVTFHILRWFWTILNITSSKHAAGHKGK